MPEFKKQHKKTPDEALERLENLCARSEYCTFEIKQKLWKWGIDASDSEKIISTLQKGKFIDDERFARAYVREKINFGLWGERKVKAALMLKKIDSQIINTVLEEIEDDVVEENLKHLLSNKARTIQDVNTYEGRTKLFRYAVSRGYLPETISKIIRSKYTFLLVLLLFS